MTRTDLLVTPEWLEARLTDPNVLALDCRVRRVPRPSGPSLYESRRDDWAAARIPGSVYVHFVEDLADPDHPTPFTLAAPAQIGATLARLGAAADTTLVVYGEGGDIGAHRVWWALSISGHPDVRALDGGLDRWRAEGRAIESGPAAPALEARPGTRPGTRPAPLALTQPRGPVATRADVAAAIDDPAICLINALSPEQHRGEGDQVFGRRGRIPGSINIPARDLIDPKTGCLRPVENLRALFDERIPAGATHLIPYCGGGIAASTLALALTVAGRADIALYDGSLLEWTQDPDAPMETG